MKRCALLLAPVIALGCMATVLAQPQQPQPLSIQLDLDKIDELIPRPVCIPLSIAAEHDKLTNVGVKIRIPAENRVFPLLVGELTKPGLLTEHIKPTNQGDIRRDLHVIVPAVQAKQVLLSVTLTEANVTKLPDPSSFRWSSKPGDYAELTFASPRATVPVLRYVHQAYDNSSAANRDKTYKVFHHLYDSSGKRFVTNGGDTNVPLPKNPKDQLYPHHRGLMYAFNSITFDGNKKCDTWHAKPGDTHQSHEGFISQEAGAVLGRHRVAVDWHGPQKQVFAKEEREMTIYKIGNGTMVEFASRLKTTGGLVKLQGDPQHAGFQFRAHNDVHEQKMDKQTYYVRPDGKGKPGDTRNWEPKTKKGPINLPWDACSFVMDKKRYTVAYLNHPNNPGESRWSERDYARFGCYFEYDLTDKAPLVVNYRVWLQDGEMTGEQVNALHKAFTQPPKVTMN